jgi:MFS family permease
MDRTNIGFAQLKMGGELGITSAQYGMGAGIFFISYSLFAVPSNLLMTKIGARRLISSCLVLWGLTAGATMLIHTATEFYAARFVLGVVEAGFFPGVIYYFTKWYPSDRRAAATGIFQSATVVAGIVSGVLSGALMTYMDGYLGMHGWQWMFLLEGLPSTVMGGLVFFYLQDEPHDAAWLSDAEKRLIIIGLERDVSSTSGHHTLAYALKSWRTYFLGIVFFLAVIGTYVLAFWQPAMIRGFGVSSIMRIGIYSTIPAIAAVIGKIWIGRHSDSSGELRWHFAAPALVGSVGLLLMPLFPHSPLLGIVCLTIAMAGVHGCIPVFWSIPGLYMSGTAAAGGIALISTMGNTAGVVGPTLLGFIKSTTGSFNDGLYILGAMVSLGAVLVLILVSRNGRGPIANPTLRAGNELNAMDASAGED